MTEGTIQEINILIANRVPPGDRWMLVDENGKPINGEVIEGIIEAMSEYMRSNDFKGDYRLSPLAGEIFAVKETYLEVPKVKPKKYDLYGEL